MTKDLPLDISESQLDKKLDESNKTKNYIDSLVEQAVEEKINLFEKKIFSEKKSGVKNSYITPSGQLKTEEKNLAEILNSAIDVPEARLIADFIEPEIRLGVKWQKNLHQETKDFLAQQKQAVKKNNVFNRKEKAINLLEKTNKIFLPVALLASENLKGLKKLFDLAKNKFLILGAYFIKAISNSIKAVDNFFSEVKTLIKEKIKPNLFFKTRYLKTAVATLIIILALVSLASLKQTAIFNQNTKRIFNNIAAQIDKPLDNFKKLFINNSHVIPGESLVKNSKNSLSSLFLNLADQTRSASLSLENNISYRNKVLARRLGSLKNQVLFIAGFWQDKYENNISQPVGLIGNQFFSLKTTLNILPDKISNFSKGSLAVLHSFINYQGESIGDIAYLIQEKFNIFYLPAQTNKISQTKGRVAGVSETAPAFSSPIPRLLALADITSRRGQQVISNTKYNTVAVLEGVADKQKALSLDLGKKLARLTLSAAKGVGFVSQSSQDKLAQAEDTINQTNSSIQEYNNNGKKYLTFEANRSLWSIYNLYSRFIDKILPDQIKEKYAKYYFVPQEDQNNKSDNKISAQQQIVVEKPIKQTAIIQSSPQLSNSIKNLSISDDTAIGGALNVSGPVSFKDNLTVVGQSEFLNDVLVHTSLTVKDLIITGSIKFAGSTITGWPLATSTQITYNNTIINSTVSAGHTEVPSLGSTGPVGSQSLSAGEGGLTVGGDTHLNGENVLIAGAVDLNNLLDIDHNGLALSIGDGTTDTFTVNTSDDIVTIAATLNHTGVSQFTGDMDLNGALDLDVASTSALTVGDGTNDNISIDTISDILTFGNSSTTDQINFNAKQLAINSASSTTALLINYDGIG